MKTRQDVITKVIADLTSLEFVKDYLIVGSEALCQLGFPMTRVPDDIDVLLYSDDRNLGKFLEILASSTNGGEEHAGSSSAIVVKVNYYVFNFFIQPVSLIGSRDFVEKNGLKYSTIRNILNVKMDYRRPKDFIFMGGVINELSKYIK